MNFLWDMVLRAQDQGMKEEDLFFTQSQEFSPFYEQAFTFINEYKVNTDVIELNLLYRFSDIFQAILSQRLKEELSQGGNNYAEFQKYLIDAALHMILYIDLRHGVTKRELYIRKLTEELLNEIFWKEAAADFRLIDSKLQIRLATLVLTQMQTGSSLIIFRRSVLVLFPDAMLYQVKADRKKLLLYLKDKRNAENERMIRFVQDMFLPLSFSLRIFWEYHFGIIGVDAVMKIDEVALY